jgi:hypothetical protein
MRIKKFGTTSVSGVDFAATDRQAALRAMHRAKVRPAAAVSSGWGTDVAGGDKRSVRASLSGKGDLRATWWNVYSRVYMALVPGADVERAMYSFHRFHHAVTLARYGFASAVAQTAGDIKQEGIVSATQRAFARDANW